jgi:hypothetical protein
LRKRDASKRKKTGRKGKEKEEKGKEKEGENFPPLPKETALSSLDAIDEACVDPPTPSKRSRDPNVAFDSCRKLL